ncbi:MAG: hypothetical protein FJ313_07235, partial [Gemmatimonadetes bacterium]|nr:hypothetical protein [Gemmatimonadota bacterium]
MHARSGTEDVVSFVVFVPPGVLLSVAGAGLALADAGWVQSLSGALVAAWGLTLTQAASWGQVALSSAFAVAIGPLLALARGTWRVLGWARGATGWPLPGSGNGRLAVLSAATRQSWIVSGLARVLEVAKWFSVSEGVWAVAAWAGERNRQTGCRVVRAARQATRTLANLLFPPILRWAGQRERDRWIDAYVVAGALLAAGVLAVLPFHGWLRTESWFRVYVCTVAAYRLTQIFITAWNVHVFDRLRGDRSSVFKERQLVLNLVNYGEIVVLFAVLWTLLGTGTVRRLSSTWEALEQSVRIAAMMGPSAGLAGPVDRVLFVSETGMALMFILFVLARAVSVMP